MHRMQPDIDLGQINEIPESDFSHHDLTFRSNISRVSRIKDEAGVMIGDINVNKKPGRDDSYVDDPSKIMDDEEDDELFRKFQK